MLKNGTDTHIITSVGSGILACQYGMNSTYIFTPENTCYRDMIEQSSLLWFNFDMDIVYPL